MITVKCWYGNGDTVVTRINGTLTDAQAYFVGQTFNLGTVDDDLQVCISVTEVVQEPPTVPESGGSRTEYLHDRHGWVPCEVTAETAEGFVVDLGRSQPWCGVVYGVAADRIRRV